VAAVIGSAVIPTIIANTLCLPHHLLPKAGSKEQSSGRKAVRQVSGKQD
jgi:glutathione-regulated potassium-efflux system ancillary protein KefC